MEQENATKNTKINWAFWLSVLSVILAFSALMAVIFRVKPMIYFCWDNVMFIVTILSLLVTILIGFQIYNFLTINKQIEKSKDFAVHQAEIKSVLVHYDLTTALYWIEKTDYVKFKIGYLAIQDLVFLISNKNFSLDQLDNILEEQKNITERTKIDVKDINTLLDTLSDIEKPNHTIQGYIKYFESKTN